MKDITKQILAFRDARDWKQFHTSESLAQAISVEAGELLELHLWGKEPDSYNVGQELADIMIFCIQLADLHGMDIESVIRLKMLHNEVRYPISKSKGNAKKYNEL